MSSSASMRCPTAPPMTVARTTKRIHPRIARLRCCALQRPAGAAGVCFGMTRTGAPPPPPPRTPHYEPNHRPSVRFPPAPARAPSAARRGHLPLEEDDQEDDYEK